MTEIVSISISTVGAIICAVIARYIQLHTKNDQKQQERIERRAQQREQEGNLQLAMLNADMKLTIGIAVAIKTGHCNGEMEKGLESMQEASERYDAFLHELAMHQLAKV